MISSWLREKLKSKASKQAKVKSKKLYCNFCGISKVHIRKGIWVLLTTWAFHCKYPDGSVHKLKAQLCVCGDQQTQGIDIFELYAPVVQWTTVHLVLLLALAFCWETIQMDYMNAFAPATLAEEVYMELPHDFSF